MSYEPIYEIYTRQLCLECCNGRIYTENLKIPWKHCSECNGTGYIKKWVDVRILIKQWASI